MPLLHAFDDNNPAAATERAAFFGVVGAKFERTASLQQAVVASVQTYWKCLAAADEEAILANRQTLSRNYLQSLHKLLGAGQIESAILDREAARQTANDANLSKVRELLALCRSDLATLVHAEKDIALPTIASAFPGLSDMHARAAGLNEAEMTELAYQKRPDLQALQQYVSGANDKLAAAQAGLDPKIDLSVNPDGVFVSVSRSLEHNSEEGVLAEAAANASDARLNVTEMRSQIARDVSQGLAALNDSLSNFDALRQSDQAMTAVLKDARHAVRTGGMDTDQLRVLEGEQADTAVRLIEAELDCVLNLAALRLTTGTVETDDPASDARSAVLFQSLEFR